MPAAAAMARTAQADLTTDLRVYNSSSLLSVDRNRQQQRTYPNREDILDLAGKSGYGHVDASTLELLHSLGLLRRLHPAAGDTAEPRTSGVRQRGRCRRCDRKRKRGCRAGLQAKLKVAVQVAATLHHAL